MKGKITLLVGGAVGYVLGTHAGRERYEQIKAQATSLWNNPKVQGTASQAQDFAREKGPIAAEKVAGAASAASEKVQSATGRSNGSKAPYPTSASTGTI